MPASLPPDDQAIDPTPVPEQPAEQAAATTTKPKSQMTQSRLPLKPTKPPDKPSAPEAAPTTAPAATTAPSTAPAKATAPSPSPAKAEPTKPPEEEPKSALEKLAGPAPEKTAEAKKMERLLMGKSQAAEEAARRKKESQRRAAMKTMGLLSDVREKMMRGARSFSEPFAARVFNEGLPELVSKIKNENTEENAH